MTKVILLILAGLLAYWFICGRPGRRPKSAAPTVAAEKMVVCAHCGLHLPESDALTGDGRSYCCDEHRRHGAA